MEGIFQKGGGGVGSERMFSIKFVDMDKLDKQAVLYGSMRARSEQRK